jgi:predicted aconitase
LSVIAVESGLAVMHIVGMTPEAPTLEAALAGRKPMDEYTIKKQNLEEAYELANTAQGREINFILLGCPHLTIRELRDLAETLERWNFDQRHVHRLCGLQCKRNHCDKFNQSGFFLCRILRKFA